MPPPPPSKGAGKTSDPKQLSQDQYREAQELEGLFKVFAKLDRNGDGKIDADELTFYLKYLGHKPGKHEVTDMIWEVDENGDKAVQWEEFKTMADHVRHDKKGLEPRKMFNLAEFMMVDKDGSGSIDLDECMEILFRRYGKDGLEAKTAEFMSLDTGGVPGEEGDNAISFSEFLAGIAKTEDKSATAFHYSQGMVATTAEENRKLMAEIYSITHPTAKATKRLSGSQASQ
tara:strand:- start:231 stop:920 length:690 start_codon:yes stop_codon:yes gene_type:complete